MNWVRIKGHRINLDNVAHYYRYESQLWIIFNISKQDLKIECNNLSDAKSALSKLDGVITLKLAID